MQKTMAITVTLFMLLAKSDAVFIVPHVGPDMDALASAIGMASICKKKKKACYIVINEDIESIEPDTRRQLKNIINKYPFINLKEAESLITPKSLMIAVDVNKTYRVCTENILDKFKNIMVIDHHKTDDGSIKTPYSFTDETLSSTSEEVSRLMFAHRVKMTPEEANLLLAGIRLDTYGMSNNAGARTYKVAARLCEKGASSAKASGMFVKNFKRDRKIQKLLNNAIIVDGKYGLACDDEKSGRRYTVQELGMISDYLMNFGVPIVFSMAMLDDETVGVSTRSKCNVDVSRIVKLLGPNSGGSPCSAAAQIKDKKLYDIRDYVKGILDSPLLLEKQDELMLTLQKNVDNNHA